MITLFGATPYFGLPDPSPFVTKAEVLLKMSGLPYKNAEMSRSEAPKGKVPYIKDGGLLLGDSHFIRCHLESKHGIDFSGGYAPRELAVAWSVERMLEEHLYWLLVHDRWAVDRNFDAGPRQFFLKAPAPLRPVVRKLVRNMVRKALHAQGTGRHTADERLALATGDIDALAGLMGNNRYLLGSRACGADATVFSFLLGTLCPLFDSDLRRYVERQPMLTAYVDRMKAEFYPEYVSAAAA